MEEEDNYIIYYNCDGCFEDLKMYDSSIEGKRETITVKRCDNQQCSYFNSSPENVSHLIYL